MPNESMRWKSPFSLASRPTERTMRLEAGISEFPAHAGPVEWPKMVEIERFRGQPHIPKAVDGFEVMLLFGVDGEDVPEAGKRAL